MPWVVCLPSESRMALQRFAPPHATFTLFAARRACTQGREAQPPAQSPSTCIIRGVAVCTYRWCEPMLTQWDVARWLFGTIPAKRISTFEAEEAVQNVHTV